MWVCRLLVRDVDDVDVLVGDVRLDADVPPVDGVAVGAFAKRVDG